MDSTSPLNGLKAVFQTLGCKLNFAETSALRDRLAAEGVETAAEGEQADLCIVNTCSVTDTADHKCRQAIHRLTREHPGAFVLVMGCYAQLRPEQVAAIEGVDLVVGMEQKGDVVRLLTERVARRGEGGACHEAIAVPTKDIRTFVPSCSRGERTRYFLKVQDGCDYYCTYCTIPYARGRSRNVPIAECVENARKIAAEGVKEIVLTGVNTGDFGRSTGESFLDLLKALNEVPGIERYRISSIEPNLLGEETIDWIASGTKFQPHFHIPLQTGSDELLLRMGRKYDTALFAGKLEYIRSRMETPGSPKVFFGIDVITGFPGESDGLFRETCDFLENAIRPAFIHIFPYSRRKGTKADTMKDQIQDSVKTERVKILEELCGRLHDGFIESNRGAHEKVLFESTGKDGKMFGYTGNYIRIERPYDASLVGQIVDVTI